jgi:hypothetical protein
MWRSFLLYPRYHARPQARGLLKGGCTQQTEPSRPRAAAVQSRQQAPNRSLTAVTSWGLWYKKADGPRDYAHVLVQSCKYPRTPYFLLQAVKHSRSLGMEIQTAAVHRIRMWTASRDVK